MRKEGMNAEIAVLLYTSDRTDSQGVVHTTGAMRLWADDTFD